MSLIERGVWSEEVETIARVGAALFTALTKQACKWEHFLPEKYVHSATIAVVPVGQQAIDIRRKLSAELDSIAAFFKGMTKENEQLIRQNSSPNSSS